MGTGIETHRMLMDSIQHKKYDVDPKRSVIEIGDMVTPETIIGFHYKTGQPVKAGLNGRVVKIYLNPVDDSVMMLAVHRNDD